ncbi:MAG TPA: hypothetical protein VEK55_04860 [Xanthobacteraceae bacterium]|nr:hypothetical protein [Xanthobacteraceae bacterium]
MFTAWAKNKMPMVISIAVPSLLKKAGRRDQSNPSLAASQSRFSALRRIMVSIEVTERANKISSFKQVSTLQKVNPEISRAQPNTNHKRIKTNGGRQNQLTAIEDRSRPYLAIVNAPIPKSVIGAKCTMIMTMPNRSTEMLSSGSLASVIRANANKNGDEQDLQILARDEGIEGMMFKEACQLGGVNAFTKSPTVFGSNACALALMLHPTMQGISRCHANQSASLEINDCARSLACDLAKLPVWAAPPTITTILLALTNTSPSGLNDAAEAGPRNPMAAPGTPTSTCACYWRPNRVGRLIGRSSPAMFAVRHRLAASWVLCGRRHSASGAIKTARPFFRRAQKLHAAALDSSPKARVCSSELPQRPGRGNETANKFHLSTDPCLAPRCLATKQAATTRAARPMLGLKLPRLGR